MKQQLDASTKKLRLSNVQRLCLAKKTKELGWATLELFLTIGQESGARSSPVWLNRWIR